MEQIINRGRSYEQKLPAIIWKKLRGAIKILKMRDFHLPLIVLI